MPTRKLTNSHDRFDAIDHYGNFGYALSWTVNGLGGNDEITGGMRRDHLSGGTGDDKVSGHDGNDSLYGVLAEITCQVVMETII